MIVRNVNIIVQKMLSMTYGRGSPMVKKMEPKIPLIVDRLIVKDPKEQYANIIHVGKNSSRIRIRVKTPSDENVQNAKKSSGFLIIHSEDIKQS